MSAKEFIIMGIVIGSAMFASNYIFEIAFPKETRVPQTIDQVFLEEFSDRQIDINRELRDRLCKVNYNQDLEIWGEEYAKAEFEECKVIVD